MVSPMILNLNQMHNHIMENLFLVCAYMNSRSNKNLIDSRLLSSERKSTAPNGAHQHFLYKRNPIPKIQYLLLRLEGLSYGTTLYLNMGYYHIEVSAKSKELCTIITQWGKYKYQRLPMGL